MICVAIELQAKPGSEADIHALFTEYIPIVEKLPGTVRFELHRARKDPGRFLLYELYDSFEALEHHRHDALFDVWRPRIAALEIGRTLTEYETLIARR